MSSVLNPEKPGGAQYVSSVQTDCGLLFGSHPDGRADASSNVDIAVWFATCGSAIDDEGILYELRVRYHHENYQHIQSFYTRAMKERLGVV